MSVAPSNVVHIEILCTKDDCRNVRNPKSTKGYCTEHKQQAQVAFRQRIADQTEARDQRNAEYAGIYAEAHVAAHAAATEHTPQAMIVQQRAHALDDTSPVVKEWHVSEGVCGFAEVIVTPGTSSFAHWVKKNRGWSKHYHGGMRLWVSDYGQSYERKVAYAAAFVEVLRKYDIKAHMSSRLD